MYALPEKVCRGQNGRQGWVLQNGFKDINCKSSTAFLGRAMHIRDKRLGNGLFFGMQFKMRFLPEL